MFSFLLSDGSMVQNLASEIEQGVAAAPASDVTASFAKMMATFFLLIVLCIATYFLIKYLVQFRLSRGVGGSDIHILEKKMLSPKTMLYLVEVENKKVLLAESQIEIKKLETFDSTNDQDHSDSANS